MTTLRIMTYNVQRCQGVDGEFNPDRVLNVIADAAPDIVALQETAAGRHGDPLPYLAEHLGMAVYRDPGGNPGAFLSHLPLRGIQAFTLGDNGYCLRADVDVSGKRLHLLNLCLESAPGARTGQVNRLLGPELLGNPSLVCPVLVLGDFADFFWSAGNLGLTSALRPALRPMWRATYPSRCPLFARDRAYLRGPVRVLDGAINRSYLARQASSHLPLTLTVQVTDTRRFLPFAELAGQRMETAPG
jgi:endonuclease/exonuclease/phosphatase family metal-dependent hydrolase